MAKELQHGTVGTELTQAEWEANGAHVIDSQATGDILYASSTSQITGLAIGSTNQVLKVVGGVPAWGAVTVAGSDLTGTSLASGVVTSSLTAIGTITTGVWNGTAITGAYINDDIISGQAEITSGLAAADELLYSDGGTVKKIGLDNFVELSPALATEDAIANGDYILFLDGSATGNMNKEAVHDLATLFAGSGLTATNSVIAVDTLNQDTTGTATNATNAAHVAVADNEDTNENDLIPFIENASATGNVGLESDGDFHYNPSTGTVTGTIFKGNIDAVDGDFDGTLETDALTIGGAAVLAQATTTGVGAVELATTAEINTSTDADRAITPDLFAASNYGIRYIQVIVVASGTAIAVTDGYAHIHIPAGLNGMDLAEVHAEVNTAPAGSTAIIEISKNGASTQMLSTNITIDATETGSDTAAAAAVIKSDGTEAVATNDVVQVNVTQVGSSTAGSGLIVTLGFRIP